MRPLRQLFDEQACISAATKKVITSTKRGRSEKCITSLSVSQKGIQLTDNPAEAVYSIRVSELCRNFPSISRVMGPIAPNMKQICRTLYCRYYNFEPGLEEYWFYGLSHASKNRRCSSHRYADRHYQPATLEMIAENLNMANEEHHSRRLKTFSCYAWLFEDVIFSEKLRWWAPAFPNLTFRFFKLYCSETEAAIKQNKHWYIQSIVNVLQNFN